MYGLIWSAKDFALQITALLEGICANLNSRIQNIYFLLYRYLFEGCYFGAFIGRAKIKSL